MLHIKKIKDFPKKGVTFLDITPLFLHKAEFSHIVTYFGMYLEKMFSLEQLNHSVIVSPEARGFIIGSAIATTYQYPFFMLRKKGKLPNDGEQAFFVADKEYGSSEFVVNTSDLKYLHEQGINNVIIVDDILATGQTDLSIANFFKEYNFNILCVLNLVEITNLGGRELLDKNNYLNESFIEETE